MNSYVWSLQEKIRRLERETRKSPCQTVDVPGPPSHSSDSDEQGMQSLANTAEQRSSDSCATADGCASDEEALIDDSSADVLMYSKYLVTRMVGLFR